MACSTYTTTTLFLLLGLFCLNLTPIKSDCDTVFEETYYIVHKVTGLIVSGYTNKHDVDLVPMDDSYVASFYNTWITYPAPRPGLFFLTIKCCFTGVMGYNKSTSGVTTGEYLDSIYQQWFLNAEGSIVNGGAYNYGLRVNRTELGQHDLYVGLMEETTVDDVFEYVISPHP